MPQRLSFVLNGQKPSINSCRLWFDVWEYSSFVNKFKVANEDILNLPKFWGWLVSKTVHFAVLKIFKIMAYLANIVCWCMLALLMRGFSKRSIFSRPTRSLTLLTTGKGTEFSRYLKPFLALCLFIFLLCTWRFICLRRRKDFSQSKEIHFATKGEGRLQIQIGLTKGFSLKNNR